MKTKTHFAFRVDIWDADANSIVEHVAGVFRGSGSDLRRPTDLKAALSDLPPALQR